MRQPAGADAACLKNNKKYMNDEKYIRMMWNTEACGMR